MAGVNLNAFSAPLTGNQATASSPPADTGAKQTDLSQFSKAATPTPPTPGTFGPAIDTLKYWGTGLESALADVVGLPRMVADSLNQSVQANDMNKSLPPKFQWGGNNANIPLLPTAPEFRQTITNATGLDYVPSTSVGRVGQKMIETGAAGLLGGPEAIIPSAAGGGAQQGAQELGLPEWAQNLFGIFAPLVTHTGISTAKTLTEPNTLAGKKIAAQKVLDQAATDPNAPIKPPIIPGAPQTLGMATDDTGIRTFERGRFNVAPNDAALADIKKGVNQATSDALQHVETFPGYNDTVTQAENNSADMHQHIVDGKEASHANESAAWQRVDPTGVLTTPIAPLEAGVQADLAKLGTARAGLFPDYVNKVIEQWKQLGPNVTLDEVKGLHTRVLNDIRDARSGATPDRNLVNALTPVEQTLRNTMDAMAATDPAQQAALDAARQASRDHHEIYDNKNVVRTLNGPPSKAGNILSTREGIDAYHAATQGAPDSLDAARKYFMSGLAKTATSSLDDNLMASRFNTYLRDNSRFLNDRRFLTQDQADVIRKSGDQLNSLQKTPASGMGGVSQTANLISQEKYAEALVGKQGVAAAKMLGWLKTAAATGVGHLLGGPLAGVGGFLASRLPGIGGIPYAEAAKGVMGLVDQALRDPAFATELRNFRNNPTTKTMTPRIKNLFRPMTNPGYQPPAP